MNQKNWLELYQNAEISAKRIERIHIHLQERHPKTVVEYKKNGSPKKLYVLDWYRSQEKFLNKEIVAELKDRGLQKSSFKSGVNFYLLNPVDYKACVTEKNSFDDIRFKALRNYFAFTKISVALTLINPLNDLKIVILYRPGETKGDLLSGGKLSLFLIEELQTREDVLIKLSIDKLNIHSKFPSYFFPVLFEDSKLINLEFSTEERGSRTTSIKKRGYILSSDKEQFLEIATLTEQNMMKLVDDSSLFKKIKRNVSAFEARKEGF
ncbi:MAG: hypothetical protein K9W42_06555 [Candidatus Heimdallarchaeota archaeon]|nr:hypothetical protein [Candidatus Heimdallarchaeota archaeon]